MLGLHKHRVKVGPLIAIGRAVRTNYVAFAPLHSIFKTGRDTDMTKTVA
jgi:hypothetical protein